MIVGLIDVDNYKKLDKCFPNLPLMKLSAYHKQQGDLVEWHQIDSYYDVVYMSKVFSFTPDYEYPISAKRIIKSGSGYAIELVDGIEVYNREKDPKLPYEIEHIYPDYSLYGITDTAYGFMTRGCPRGCEHCHVEIKEGRRTVKVADLSEFWNGQKYIQLCDPNTLACKDWKNILQQLIDSDAWIDFNQGVDIRLMTEEKCEMFKKVKVKNLHFAWDRYKDKDFIVPKFEMFKRITGIDYRKLSVYVLTNFNTTIEQDLERINTLRELGYTPYVMRYNKKDIPRGATINKIARWVNNRVFFRKYKTFEEYCEAYDKGLTF